MKARFSLLALMLASLWAPGARADALVDDPSLAKVADAVPMQLHAFALQDVRLLDGPFKHAMELDQAYLLSLDPDRLLRTFRVNAGLPTDANPLGGWEAPDCELRGHFVGHYLSACAMMYASTGDERFKDRCTQIVAALAECQDKLGGGYLSAFPETFFDRVEARRQVWAPYYTLHKVLAGLLDTYVYCGNDQALAVCRKLADWVIIRNSPLSDAQMQSMLQTEQGGMNEVLANLYAITGEKRYLTIALRFNHLAVIGPATREVDSLNRLHANTQIPKFIGTAREYELTGQASLETASMFFWHTVADERSYVIGGNSNNESFSPKDRLSLALGPRTTETCNTYNMLKLTRHLFCWDPREEYADFYERALYNHILASQDPTTGMMCYYVPLASGSRKNYSLPLDSFWCCTGTGVENHSKYGDSIYFHGQRDLYVNLFIASELHWKNLGLTVRQETSFPDEGATKLVFSSDAPVSLSLHLRHPAWATSGFEVRVNGERQTIADQPASYVVIDRTWNKGDVVEVSMPFQPHIEAFADNPNRFAVLNGPLVLCAEVPTAKSTISVAVAPQNSLAALTAADKPSTFSAASKIFQLSGGGEVTLEPFYKMHGERRYVVYFDAAAPAAPSAPQAPPTRPAAADAAPRDYPVRPVSFTAVRMTDEFWAPKIEINRTATIPAAFAKCEETGRVDNFLRAAAALRGEKLLNLRPPGYPFDDTDIYKVLEGASYSLSVHPDPKLDAYLDGLIADIAAAQEPDGYIYTARTINPSHPHSWSGPQRWMMEEIQSHELYCDGHLFEAAVAHFQATGKRSLLNVAIKAADLLDKTFGPGKREIYPGHQIAEMGLAKLYRATGDVRYLNLAKFLLDCRGPTPTNPGSAYNQSNIPVVDQTEAVGHAVRATYMYSGMADVAALTGDQAYANAIDKIWDNVVSKKLYITGGIGATASGEAFGRDYELPNMTAYNETCAAVGNVLWNQRLTLLHGDARYADVLERTLYNGLISGVSLDGKTFFYPNPLESRGQNSRSPWFGVACCPGNIARFMASVSGYVYGVGPETIYVNLFAACNATVRMDDGGSVKLVQETRYPWDGHVKLTVTPDRSDAMTIAVRIPSWARNEPVPSDLYRFADASAEQPTLSVNGQAVQIQLDKGYAVLTRNWQAGDVIDLNLPMPVRRVLANDAVTADRGRVALQRGPIVYCAEWPDNPGGDVRNLLLSDDQSLTAEFKSNLLNGVEVIEGQAETLARDDSGGVTRTEQNFTAIPYYAWANRGRGTMTVWIPDALSSARVRELPTIAATARLTASRGTSPESINDLHVPASSGDESQGFFHWWPKKGTVEWAQYAFAKPTAVAAADVYWFDDGRRGECRVPQSWRILYRDDKGQWVPVTAAGAYGTAQNQYNRIEFSPVTTSALRLEVTLQPNWSAGIQQWRVYAPGDRAAGGGVGAGGR